MASKILRNYLPELKAFVLGRTRPGMVTVNLTNQCNQNCIYCEIGEEHQAPGKNALVFNDIIWIIDEMSKNKIRKISLCGGEPFLFKRIIDIVAYAKKKNVRCSITTNGMNVFLLNNNDLNILKECKTEINVSIDSFQESIQAYTRGSSVALTNALKSINKLNEKNIPVTVLTVISKYNFNNLFVFLKEAYNKGIKQVLFQPVIYFSNYPERISIEKKSLLNVGIDKLDILMEELNKILRFERKHNIKTNVYRIFPWIKYYLLTAASRNGEWFFNNVLKKFYCREIYAIIDIDYNGGIQPCGLVQASVFINNNGRSGLKALWTEATKKIRNDLENDKYYYCCNGCCHHFSRNMLASVFKYPFKNRKALINLMPLLFVRIHSGIFKKLKSFK